MKLNKWSLYNEAPALEAFEAFREAFAESNKLIYTPSVDSALYDLWSTVVFVYGKIASVNMERWLPADMYFHLSAASIVWFFSVHMRQPGLGAIDMKCSRYGLPLNRGRVRADPHAISVMFYLTGVLSTDEEMLRNLFPDADVSCNEVIVYLS